jgi:hypothetical protein
LLFLFWLVDALTADNARIAALEAELTVSREAWEGANAAKVAAEKATKSAETNAKKAEKALVTADQKWVQRERTIANVSTRFRLLLAVSVALLFFGCLLMLLVADICLLSLVLPFYGAAERIGVSLGLRQPNTEDPLLAAMDLLEANWKLVQEVL